MKKSFNIIAILLLVVLIISLVACKKQKPVDVVKPNEKPVKPVENNVESEENREKIMKGFNNILSTKKPAEILDYINENISKLTTIEGDKMVLELQNLLENSLDSFTNKILSMDKDGELMNIAGLELFFPEESIKDIKDEKLREEIENLFNSKYKLINVEGQYYPIVDYEKFKQYNKYMSDEIKDYIKIKAKVSNDPMALDAGLRISYDELANRIVEVEKYIQKYSEGQKYEEMLGMYRDWLGFYIAGLPNTPIADFYTKKIFKDVMESYGKTANIKDSSTAFVINKYIKIIDENKGIINKVVEDEGLSLINEALSLLETSK